MDFFIHSDEVINSINYFKELSLDTDDNLFLFLMAKRAGISVTYPVTFMTSKLSDEN